MVKSVICIVCVPAVTDQELTSGNPRPVPDAMSV